MVPPPAPIVPAPPGAPAPPENVAAVAVQQSTGAAAAAQPVLRPSHPAATLPEAAGGGYRLLAVDDDPQVTKHIRSRAGRALHRGAGADTVSDAMNIVEQNPAGLMVASDLSSSRAPTVAASSVASRSSSASAHWPDLPVVLFTDYQNEEAETKAKSLGVTAVLTKPRKAQVQAAARTAERRSASFLRSLDGLEPHRRNAPSAQKRKKHPGRPG